MSAHTAHKSSAQNPSKPIGDSATHSVDLFADAKLLLVELRELSSDYLQLFSLEIRQAGKSFVSMVLATLILGFLVACVWAGVMAVLVLTLITHDLLDIVQAVLVVIAVNLFLSLLVIRHIRHQCNRLMFPETIRSLRKVPYETG